MGQVFIAIFEHKIFTFYIHFTNIADIFEIGI